MGDVESTEGDEAVLIARQQASEATELAIDAADKLAEKALKDCYDHANLQTNFAHYNLCKKGAELVEPLLSAYLKDKCKKPKERSEHALNNAMQTAGSKFEKQNSGFDMSTQNGMNTTGKFSSIADIVEAVYPVNHPYHNPIKQQFVKY